MVPECFRKNKNTPAAPRVLIARYHLDFSLVCPLTPGLRHAYVDLRHSAQVQNAAYIRCFRGNYPLSRMRLGSGVLRIRTGHLSNGTSL